MNPTCYHLQFITPCFCAGEDQAVAEVRAPSIRGRLRWWFRVLGGTRADEARIFGSVAGDRGQGSAVILRVRNLAVSGGWQPIQFSPQSNIGYLLYFAKASGQGVRWVSTGAVPAGGTFELEISWRRKMTELQARFELTLQSFLMLGSLGLRSTRGLGCFECRETPFSADTFKSLLGRIKKEAPAFLAEIGQFAGSRDEVLDGLGIQLRSLRNGFSAGAQGRSNPSPLGSSQPRQASAVYLRPVREPEGRYRIVVFEVPAERVLGPESRKGAPRLKNGLPSPESVPRQANRFEQRRRVT